MPVLPISSPRTRIFYQQTDCLPSAFFRNLLAVAGPFGIISGLAHAALTAAPVLAVGETGGGAASGIARGHRELNLHRNAQVFEEIARELHVSKRAAAEGMQGSGGAVARVLLGEEGHAHLQNVMARTDDSTIELAHRLARLPRGGEDSSYERAYIPHQSAMAAFSRAEEIRIATAMQVVRQVIQ